MHNSNFNIDELMELFNERLKICKYNTFGVNDKGEFYIFENTINKRIISNFIIIPLGCIHNRANNEDIIKYSFTGIIKGIEVLRVIEVFREDLANSKWIEKWSPFCELSDRKKSYKYIKEYLFECLDTSKKIVEYDEIGWIKHKEKWIFLSTDNDIELESETIRSSTKDFSFKKDDDISEKEAFVKSFQMLNICNKKTTVPLLSYSLLSIITTPLVGEDIPPKFSMWLYGFTGIGKTSLASLFTNVFSRKNLINFQSFKNIINEKMNKLKDCVSIMDDFGTAKTRNDENTMIQKTERLVRLLGDRGVSGDEDVIPKGLILFTGEKFINYIFKDASSSMARCIRVEMDNLFNENVEGYDECKKKMFNYYEKNKFLSTSIYYYIKWLQVKINSGLLVEYKEKFNKYRNDLSFSHSRYCDTYAHLMISFENYLEYGLKNDFINVKSYHQEIENIKNILRETIELQNEPILDEEVKLFIKTLKNLIVEDKIIVKIGLVNMKIDNGEIGFFDQKENKIIFIWDLLCSKIEENIPNTRKIGRKVLGKKLRNDEYIVDFGNSDRSNTTKRKLLKINGNDIKERVVEFYAEKIPDIKSLILDNDPEEQFVEELNKYYEKESYDEYEESCDNYSGENKSISLSDIMKDNNIKFIMGDIEENAEDNEN